MNKLWFRAKRYGYGWYPSSWEGWLVLLAYIALLFCGLLMLVSVANDANGRAGFFFAGYVVLITAALTVVAAKKGEKPGWRWGKPKK